VVAVDPSFVVTQVEAVVSDMASAAVIAGKAFVREALVGASGWNLGSGRGPIDHLGWTSKP
jgi:hydroxymethylpyrimidine/phosphomethylpyrimidine kinase